MLIVYLIQFFLLLLFKKKIEDKVSETNVEDNVISPCLREPHRRTNVTKRHPDILKRNIKIIGQERGKLLLYAYDGFSDDRVISLLFIY